MKKRPTRGICGNQLCFCRLLPDRARHSRACQRSHGAVGGEPQHLHSAVSRAHVHGSHCERCWFHQDELWSWLSRRFVFLFCVACEHPCIQRASWFRGIRRAYPKHDLPSGSAVVLNATIQEALRE